MSSHCSHCSTCLFPKRICFLFSVSLHCLTTSHCSSGWWRSSCCWLTSPRHTTSTRNSPSWLCSGATLHPKPKWWMSCRSSATSWESTSICPQQEPCMSVDRLLYKSSFFLFDLLICASLFKWLNKENSEDIVTGRFKITTYSWILLLFLYLDSSPVLKK